MPWLPVLGRELKGVADTKETLKGDCDRQPPATADTEGKWVKDLKESVVMVDVKEGLSMLWAAEHSHDWNRVENARKEYSGVEDSKEVKEAKEAALGLDSWEYKDVDEVTDDSKNTGGW